MKRQNRLESELLEAGFRTTSCCPKRLTKIEGTRVTAYQLIPERYELIYDGEIKKYPQRFQHKDQQ